MLRLTSRAAHPIRVTIELASEDGAPFNVATSTYVASVLSAPSLADVNTAAQPQRVAPAKLPPKRLSEPLDLPAYAFVIVNISSPGVYSE